MRKHFGLAFVFIFSFTGMGYWLGSKRTVPVDNPANPVPPVLDPASAKIQQERRAFQIDPRMLSEPAPEAGVASVLYPTHEEHLALLFQAATAVDLKANPIGLDLFFRRLDIQEIYQGLENLKKDPPGPARRREELAYLRRWGQLDAELALAYARASTEPKHRQELILAALAGFSGANPKEAFAWLEQHPEEIPDKKKGLQVIFEELARANSEVIYDFLQSIDLRLHSDHTRTLMSELFDRSSKDFIAWQHNLSEETVLHNVSYSVITSHLGRIDPEKAEWWIDHHLRGSDHESALRKLGAVMAESDPLATISWYQNLPEEKKKPEHLHVIARVWLRFDPVSCQKWEEAHMNEPGMDLIKQHFVVYARDKPLINRLEIATTIEDPQIKQQALEMLSWGVLEKHPEEAVPLLVRAGLNEQHLELIRKSREKKLAKEQEQRGRPE